MGIIRDSFIIFKNWSDAINALPEEYQLEAYKSLVYYGTTGDMPNDISPVTKAILISFSVGMENSICRYNASVENGKKGGRPKKISVEETQQNLEKPRKTQTNPEKPNHNLNVNVNVNDNENNIVVDDIHSTNITHARENNETTSTTLQDLEELQSICKGISIDCLVDPYKFDFSLLVKKVKESRYLMMFRTLSELLNKYDDIIADKYKDFVLDKYIKNNGVKKREYTKEEFDALFDDIESIEI